MPLVSVMEKFRGSRGLFRVIREIRGELFSVALWPTTLSFAIVPG